MKKINFAEPFTGKLEKKYLNDALNSGWISKGPYVEKFENNFSKVMGCKFSVSVNNGTNALLLILLSLDLKKNDEIIVPSLCYISPIHMLRMLKIKIVPVAVDINTFQIDHHKIEKKITKNTKAILTIHNFGGISDIKKIENIAKKNNIILIEDISETLLSKDKKKYVGVNNDLKLTKLSFSSLHATKTITTGEGGIIFLNNKILSDKIKNIRDHGIKDSKRYLYHRLGGNFRISNLLAAIGYAQLRRINQIKKKKKFINNYYVDNLINNKNIKFQKDPKNFTLIKWGFPIIVKNLKIRNKLINHLNKKSTICRPSFLSLNYMQHLGFKKNDKEFKSARYLQDRILILPMHINLSSQNLNYICKTINYNLK